MSSWENNLFIKDGYVANVSARTLDIEPSDRYWTDERIEYSARYQHHVYLLAARIAAQNQYRVGLDLGCGSGTKAARILSKVLPEIILVDQPSSEKLAKKALPDANFVSADLETCEFVMEAQMDLIICADVVEHLADPLPCINFARDHLKTTGTAIFSTPERDILRGPDCMTSPHPAHVREWNATEFRALLEHVGFRVLRHMTIPMGRLPPLEELARLSLHRILRLQRWHSGQVVVCIK
jgi:2-polyprenyl-3-methyl-5-hydroxy-6-metoxy-1,4-benzoquinol methylase